MSRQVNLLCVTTTDSAEPSAAALQVASITTDVQQQVGGAVQAALSQTLPQELAGPHLKAALQASLGSQLQHALARPLQDSFTASFQQHLMPAFEGACRDMFTQVGPYLVQQPCFVSAVQQNT